MALPPVSGRGRAGFLVHPTRFDGPLPLDEMVTFAQTPAASKVGRAALVQPHDEIDAQLHQHRDHDVRTVVSITQHETNLGAERTKSLLKLALPMREGEARLLRQDRVELRIDYAGINSGRRHGHRVARQSLPRHLRRTRLRHRSRPGGGGVNLLQGRILCPRQDGGDFSALGGRFSTMTRLTAGFEDSAF